MFDKTFFRFAFGLFIIIGLSLGVLYVAGYFENGSDGSQTAIVH
ncbi:MAG TPA: hypothetical protein VFT82_04130 [Candidatus Paceibacterota bacterium]|nr:hypothetical protein [Candidatus Paceibacterota bacterium]